MVPASNAATPKPSARRDIPLVVPRFLAPVFRGNTTPRDADFCCAVLSGDDELLRRILLPSREAGGAAALLLSAATSTEHFVFGAGGGGAVLDELPPVKL